MLYKINVGTLCILLAALMIASCASNQSTNDSSQAVFPSKALLTAGVGLQKKHSLKDLKASFFNADISENKLNSEAYLSLFLKDILAANCVWYLSKWHLEDGLLAYQLECNKGTNEILFKGKLTGDKYQLNDIYSHEYGFWLSELVAEQLTYQGDLPHWLAVMNEIRELDYGQGRANQIVAELEGLKRESYFSEMLKINYEPESSTSDALFMNNIQKTMQLSLIFPQYPSTLGMSIAAANDEYDTALAILDKIESKVGQSKMALLRRSWFHYKQGDMSQAYHYAIYAHKYGVNSFWPSFYLIRYSIETEQYNEALELMKLELKPNKDWSDSWIAEFEHGNTFLELSTYKQWRNQT